jgi:hypothetical protein
MKNLHVSELREIKLVTGKKTDEGEENPIKNPVMNKIDAPTEHVVRSYTIRWRI